jgi:hypothetical protein
MSDNPHLNKLWLNAHAKEQCALSNTDDPLFVKQQIHFKKVYAGYSTMLKSWSKGLTDGTITDATKALLGPELWFDLLGCKVEMLVNTFVTAHCNVTKEPVAIALYLCEVVKIQSGGTGRRKNSDKALTDLHEFVFCADWTAVRACLKLLHMYAKYDELRANYRFNFGFAEMMVPVSRNFIGMPVDESFMVYPRICQVQLDGSYKCDIILDHVIRLIGFCKIAFDADALPGSPGLASVYPLRFPLFVQGLDTFQRLALGIEPYISGCDVANRVSICIWEGPKAAEESDQFANSTLRETVSNCANKKFSTFKNSTLHIDKNDLNTLQMVIVVSYHVPEECFTMIDLKDNNFVLFHDTNEVDAVKFYVYLGYFNSHYHGKVQLDPDWQNKCPDDAWLIRIAPYTTRHCEAWGEKLVRQGMLHTVKMVRSFYMTPGSAYLGLGTTEGDNRN